MVCHYLSPLPLYVCMSVCQYTTLKFKYCTPSHKLWPHTQPTEGCLATKYPKPPLPLSLWSGGGGGMGMSMDRGLSPALPVRYELWWCWLPLRTREANVTATAIAEAWVKLLCIVLTVSFHSGCHRGLGSTCDCWGRPLCGCHRGLGSTCDCRGRPLDAHHSALRALNVAAFAHLGGGGSSYGCWPF